ncbi:MAG: prepilin peptidase dependent protein B [Paraglaciecola sp.]|nr:prepilin peptidase dependent protein B [Paraglaciecola sp.]
MLNRLLYQTGTSLVELMISMAIGFASLTAMASLVGHGIGLNSQLMAKSRLDEEVNAVAALMIRDIKRAGYDGNIAIVVNDPNQFVSVFDNSLAVYSYPGEAASSCVEFSYDRNQNGVLDVVSGNENFGYRLKDNAIEIRIDGLSCEAGGWHDLTDPDIIKVSHLKFVLQQQNNHGVNTHRIAIELQAELKSDSSVSKRFSTSFLVKNYD